MEVDSGKTNRIVDLTGKKVGRLTVLGLNPERTRDNKTRWDCRCVCGKVKTIRATHIKAAEKQGLNASCGCVVVDNAKAKAKHNMCFTPEYKAWSSMLSRCYYQDNASYDRYGGRGIKVCEQWRFSFNNFYDDLGKIPAGGYSLERMNVDGDYEPDNCKWASHIEQSYNKSTSIKLEYNGELLTIPAIYYSLLPKPVALVETFIYRVLGKWPITEAAYTPGHDIRSKRVINGRPKTFVDRNREFIYARYVWPGTCS